MKTGTYRGVYGRGTIVTAVNIGVIGLPASDQENALKLSWKERTCTHEGVIINEICASVPDYLPDPVYHSRIGVTDDNLPGPAYDQSYYGRGM